jgi:hypothetical protein
MSRNILIVEAFAVEPRSLAKYRENAAKTRAPNGNRTLFRPTGVSKIFAA